MCAVCAIERFGLSVRLKSNFLHATSASAAQKTVSSALEIRWLELESPFDFVEVQIKVQVDTHVDTHFELTLKPSFFGQFKGVYTTFYKALYKTLQKTYYSIFSGLCRNSYSYLG